MVFEPNNEKLWARVRASITEFLTRVWKGGALMGIKPEEAFFVKCDRTTMTQDDIDNGRLICIIGLITNDSDELHILAANLLVYDTCRHPHSQYRTPRIDNIHFSKPYQRNI